MSQKHSEVVALILREGRHPSRVRLVLIGFGERSSADADLWWNGLCGLLKVPQVAT